MTVSTTRPAARASLVLAVTLLVLLSPGPAPAQVPTVLTDKVYQGDGTIDILKDISGSALSQYIGSDGRLLLGIDLNESVGGNESSTSVGVALEQVSLIIVTTAGTFTFSDFYTNTTAMITEAGTSVAQSFYTLFGNAGSSAVTGSTTDAASFDDVIALQNISFEGEVLSAQLSVTFLDTANTKGSNETFFDYSGGPEDFALLSAYAAQAIETTSAGLTTAPTTVTYTQDTSSTATYVTSPTPTAPTSGAPAPPLPVLVGAALLAVLWRARG